MIAIGRGQLHAPDRTIPNEPDRVEEGRLSCAVRPEQDIHGLEGQRNISQRAIILDLICIFFKRVGMTEEFLEKHYPIELPAAR